MSRGYGLDIITELEDRLNDITYGINAQIETINSDRGLETPLVTGVYSDAGKRQYPECYIDLSDESVIDTETLSMDIAQSTEEYPASITVIIREGNLADNKINKYCEAYIEALEKCLNGYSSTYVTWILCIGGIRGDLYDKAKNTFKICGVKISVRTN